MHHIEIWAPQISDVIPTFLKEKNSLFYPQKKILTKKIVIHLWFWTLALLFLQLSFSHKHSILLGFGLTWLVVFIHMCLTCYAIFHARILLFVSTKSREKVNFLLSYIYIHKSQSKHVNFLFFNIHKKNTWAFQLFACCDKQLWKWQINGLISLPYLCTSQCLIISIEKSLPAQICETFYPLLLILIFSIWCMRYTHASSVVIEIWINLKANGKQAKQVKEAKLFIKKKKKEVKEAKII